MDDIYSISRIIKILSNAKKSQNLTRSKKPELGKTINKVFKIDFLSFGAKMTFLNL